MHRSLLSLLVALAAILALAGVVVAQEGAFATGEGFNIRIGGDAVVGPDETLDVVIVVDGNATIDGRVTEGLWVAGGNATVNGQVDGDIFVTNGSLTLADGSTVENVALVQSTLDQAAGATITGTLNERVDQVALGWGAAVFSFFLWIGLTLVVLAAGLLFAALGYRQLIDAVTTLVSRPGGSVITALVIWIGLPLLAILAMVTVVGIPVGLAIFFLVMPLLFLLGYIVAGEALGAVLGHLVGWPQQRFLSVVIGLVVLQLVNLVPAIGPLIGTLAGLVGAGALVYRLFLGWSSQPRPTSTPPTTIPVQTAPR